MLNLQIDLTNDVLLCRTRFVSHIELCSYEGVQAMIKSQIFKIPFDITVKCIRSDAEFSNTFMLS